MAAHQLDALVILAATVSEAQFVREVMRRWPPQNELDPERVARNAYRRLRQLLDQAEAGTGPFAKAKRGTGEAVKDTE